MKTWSPNPEQQDSLDRYGYCVLPNVISRDEAMMVKGAILNHILQPDTSAASRDESDPMDPMAGPRDPEAFTARLRKLGAFGEQSPLLWHQIYTNDAVCAIARHFLGSDDLVLKFNSCFLKPAKTGSSTPWHQDNGLWRDGDRESFNFWMAIDPATKENGCMQFIPASHRGEIIPHIEYPGGIHGELPREHVAEMIDKLGLHHIELDPGSAVCWHSNLYHFSPPNVSEKSRIAVAGVYSTVASAARNPFVRRQRWVMRAGELIRQFPAQPFTEFEVEQVAPPPYPKAA
jgi:ectoine hydroxylase-related dioxygenase (phytanoyl-CoA dioxygenase family)